MKRWEVKLLISDDGFDSEGKKLYFDEDAIRVELLNIDLESGLEMEIKEIRPLEVNGPNDETPSKGKGE